mmetsp:Transcript_104733/g.182043  ORF Transcript_104733/g.182043 Transcript_104733/m.182043 type:complete len:851 (-) Transcript_104733:19-2571(-)
MKFVAANFFFAMLVLCTAGAELSKERKVMRTGDAVATQDKTITQVVKMLEGILEKSKFEGESERTAYAKYMCDCDKRIEEYTTTIATSQEDITLLANEIAQLKAENGKLSTECAKLTAAIAANEADQAALNSTRADENTKFLAFKSDLDAAIGQLEEAVKTLAEVSADQTLAEATAKDHTKFMSGYVTKYNPVSLLRVKSSLKSVLAVASAAMDDKKARTMASFLQAPFTGSYTSQSVEVMGILKNMKDKFERDVDEAVAQEAAQLEAWTKVIQIKIAEAADMAKSYDKKQLQLASNDDALSTKTGQKTDTEALMEEAESFLAQTEEACAAKKKEYAKRRLLQTQEEAALSEAIAILDSDASFGTFGTVSATSTGSLYPSALLQLKSIRKHSSEKEIQRSQLMQILQKAKGSKRVSKLMSVVQATNVFQVVLDEIDKMLEIIVEEGKADKENLDFCNSERTTNDGVIAEKTTAIEEVLEPAIAKLTKDINDPEVGLKKQISDTEESLLQNKHEQKTSTEERAEANALYKEDMANLAEAKAILAKALGVLKAYYKYLDEQLKLGLLQKRSGHLADRRSMQAPKTNTPLPTEDTAVLKMQGESASGSNVIDILSHIRLETEEEEKEAEISESNALQAYEAEMAGLKSSEASLQSTLATLEGDLATTEKNLLQTEEDLKTTEDEKAAAEKYLADIKPGCDFITANFETRENSRSVETGSLQAAIVFIKSTPTYAAYEAEVHVESLGGCVAACAPGEGLVACKACLADVTVPAYCAGHPDQADCGSVETTPPPPTPPKAPPKAGSKGIPKKTGGAPKKTAGAKSSFYTPPTPNLQGPTFPTAGNALKGPPGFKR